MVRLLAWEVLRSGSVTPLREVDVAADEVGLDPRDRGLLRAIVGAEVRHRGTLRALVNAFARGRPKAGLRAHLHLGFAQLLYLDRLPPRAVLSEQVDATRHTLGASKTTYVNAVLRALLRARKPGHCGDPRRDVVGAPWHLEQPVFHDREEHPALWAEDALSIPGHLFKRWHKRHGLERAVALGTTFLDPPDLSLRAVGGDRAALVAELADARPDQELVEGAHPDVVLVRGDLAGLFDLPAFAEGRATVQGESALRAAGLVQARPDEELLDLCAAPGGKTAVLAGAGARVTAVDVSEAKLARLTDTAARLGLAERVEPLLAPPLARDAGAPADPDLPGHAPGPADYVALGERSFDGVLVDAPCSNTGVLGARPGARWRFGPSNQKALVTLQAALLREGAARVRPGGRLVWSTCSIEPEENRQLLRPFLEEHPGWVLEEEHEALPGPTEAGGPVDGGYAARLRRPAS